MTALPQLDGLDFRMFRGPSDYAHFVRIINAWARAEGDDRVETLDGIASGYDHLERCEPARDLLVVEIGGTPVGYSRVWWDQEPDGPRVYKFVCFVDPEHDEAPQKLLQAFCNDRNLAAVALLRAADYEPTTYSAEMVRPTVSDLPDHRLPEGLEIRAVRDEDLRTIWEAEGDAFRDHWGYVEPTEAGYQHFLARPYTDSTLWKIAWDDEGVAGQVRSFIDTAANAEFGRQRGWTEDISTARRWRRRGVAKALIVESIRELAARGMTEVALGVHTENPNGAYDLYAGLGYEVVGTWTVYRKAL